MATMRLTPSTYYLSSSTYLNVSNADNMYNNTDNTTYATVTNTYTGTTTYYIYLRGFNFDAIPDSAIVNSFTVKVKANESGVSTSTSYSPRIANGTTSLTSNCNAITTTVQTLTLTGITDTWQTIKNYGSNFGIRVANRRNSRNTTSYLYIYGAQIEVDYTVPDPKTVTTTLTGDGTIEPSGETITYNGEEFELTITPTNKNDQISVIQDGVDVTSQLVSHYAGGTENTNLGTYALVSGSFNSNAATYFQGIVGNSVNATQTSSNYYSGGSGVIAVFTYDMAFTIPSNATIERVWCEVNGHAESTSNASEYMCAMLISGSTELTEELNFKDIGTSNTTQTLECTTLPTVSQLASMKLQCRLGYYGGAINGATAYVTYSIPGSGGPEYYTYSYTVNGDSTISVVIGSSGSSPVIYIKENGVWTPYSKVYLKQNGSWVEQNSSDWSTLFNINTNYRKG